MSGPEEPLRKRWACRPPDAGKRVFNRRRDAISYADKTAPPGCDPESFVWREVLGGDGHWRRG